MLDLQLDEWWQRQRPFAVATVVEATGSAPRPIGSALAVDADGRALGSVSGGCVEGAVYEACVDALGHGGRAPAVEEFGYSDEDAFAVGLTCGGRLRIAVRRVVPGGADEAAARAAAAGRRVVLATVLGTGESLAATADGAVAGRLSAPALHRAVASEAAARLDTGRSGLRHFVACPGAENLGAEVFFHAVAPPPRLLVFGAIDFAGALVRAGKLMGRRVTVCDARSVFATRARFPEADEVVVDWPHRYLAVQRDLDARTAVCVLTHDAKFDVPVLLAALRGPAGYVGAMGSRRTCEQRLASLREAGLTARELARLRAPIGLDLGAATPEETAVSIVAEIVALRRGGTGLPLAATSGPIHSDQLTLQGS
ncbi:hypothetical protein BIV57_16050 [Mangrovactinospora gilvigrisea]|uniref:Xanthine dehydrogenase n=1 Tax=Mangrovactinospora gilvigrisea TaxID=1428644 RepID=A0A1J7BD14_9ACTN|nr:XdhC/CoxI family protein [Mangrovactinospora gilvigrisea]OIV36477.1 hypothetical protein BIV57_16050 [Mangrovactinospora gilvigrisea]